MAPSGKPPAPAPAHVPAAPKPAPPPHAAPHAPVAAVSHPIACPAKPAAKPVAAHVAVPVTAPRPKGAHLFENVASFGRVQQPVLMGHGGKPIQGITDSGPRTLKFRLRVGPHAEWWDGNFDGKETDRQRAEVHPGDGAPALVPSAGETWEFGTTLRLCPGFVPSGDWTYLFQLKPPNGDPTPKTMPVAVLRIFELHGALKGSLQLTDSEHSDRVVRVFDISPDRWVDLRWRIKTTRGGARDGLALLSVNGDAFQGLRDASVTAHPGTKTYFAKFGMYRGFKSSGVKRALADTDMWVEHRDVYMARLAAA